MSATIHHLPPRIRQAPPFPAESPTSFATPIRPRNEPADRFADNVYALNRLSPECERVGRRALFAFGRGVDGCGYCTDRREVVEAIRQLESLPDGCGSVAHGYARAARLALLVVLEPRPPEQNGAA
jgi:hypothetical protein